jgi:NCAIR mutase (PurE)-related protein
VSVKWAAIIHSIVSALAVIPSIGLAVGLTIGAGDSRTGALATMIVWLSGLFPGVLVVSIIAVWLAYGTRHLRAVWAALAFPWTSP